MLKEAKMKGLKDSKGKLDLTGLNLLAAAVEHCSKELETDIRLMKQQIMSIYLAQLNDKNPFSKKPEQAFTDHESRKRCFEAGESSTGVKKQKHSNMNINGWPERLRQMIRSMGGRDEMLVIKKQLYKTDCSQHHSRLSIPVSQVKAKFLTHEEKKVLERKEFIEALLIEPCLERRKVTLRKWDMGKTSGKTCSTYALVGGWKSVVADNDLKTHDTIQLWSFRVESALCFALLIVN